MYTHFRQGRQGSRGLAWLSILGLLLAMIAATIEPAAASTVPDGDVSVVVREAAPDTGDAEALVESLGGVVGEHLSIIGGFAATVPLANLDVLAADGSVHSVTTDDTLAPKWGDRSGWTSDSGSSLDDVTGTIDAGDYWNSGHNGRGVDVALIDTGVAPVDGLDGWGKVINGVDLSFESQNPNTRFLDSNGHGTHMAGIIAGHDYGFKGVAYKSRIVNVKVGAYDGSVDVSQVIAAIDWVVQHKNDNGMNIRVLNLSYGTDSLQDPSVDPLSYAVEQAWKSGIVVVVAAGNDGAGTPLRNPANNPYVIAVGATNIKGDSRTYNDEVASFSSCGVGRTVDLVAPGKSIESLRVRNSVADLEHADARVGWDRFKGSGTSQAAAVVSGAAALIIDQRPTITPDQVKALLMDTAKGVDGSADCQGAGQIDLERAEHTWTPRTVQDHPAATGQGSLEAARGTHHVSMDGVELVGEIDIHGLSWSAENWAQAAALGTSWSGDLWNGTSWSGTSWSGTSWSGTSWSGTSWSNQYWTGTSWSGTSWSGESWSSASWSGSSWSSVFVSSSSGVRWD